MNIVILDACRNNAFKRSWSRSSAEGLAKMDSPSGTIIAYATAPGETASDGTGRNGLYTAELLKHLDKKNLGIVRMFNNVGLAVAKQTDGEQEPYLSLSPVPEFCLAGCNNEIKIQPREFVEDAVVIEKPTQTAIEEDTIEKSKTSALAKDETYRSIQNLVAIGEHEKAMHKLQPLGIKNDPIALAMLANLYDSDEGKEKDTKSAKPFAQRAIDNGIESYADKNQYAQATLGWLHYSELIQLNPEKGYKWSKKAALQGNGFAMINLGLDFEQGLSQKTDANAASYWYRAAKDKGYVKPRNKNIFASAKVDKVPKEKLKLNGSRKNILINDNFDTVPASGWAITTYNDGTKYEVVDGVYRMKPAFKHENVFWSTVESGLVAKDNYKIKTTITLKNYKRKNRWDGPGIIWGLSNPKSYCFFQVTHTGHVRAGQVKNNVYTYPFPDYYNRKKVKRGKNSTNQLEVAREDGKFKFLVNGHHIKTVPGWDCSGTQVGVRLKGASEVEVDDFYVERL